MHNTSSTHNSSSTHNTSSRNNSPIKAQLEENKWQHQEEAYTSRAVGDSSDDEVSEEDDDGSVADESSSSGSYCKEQKIENEAFRKRLDKLHRRLKIARKSCCGSILYLVKHFSNHFDFYFSLSYLFIIII